MVELLLKAGANREMKNGSKRTAWDYLDIVEDRAGVTYMGEPIVDFEEVSRALGEEGCRPA